MTIPMEYRTAEKVFEQYLDDALEASGLATRNQIYTMTQGVFQCFRRRLEFQQAASVRGMPSAAFARDVRGRLGPRGAAAPV